MARLDTHRAVKQLQEAGVPEAQAEAHVRLHVEADEEATRELVTEATLYRALLIQGGVILGVNLAGVAALLALFEAF